MTRLPVALTLLALTGCPPKKPFPPPPPSGRCEVDLEALGLFSTVGSGAKATVVDSESALIGGEMAHGQRGDFLLENEQIRVVIQGVRRELGPGPYGGTLIDADLKRPSGEAGRDQLGKISVLYQFGRTLKPTQVEVLVDGGSGGFAVVAATGTDALNDALNVPSVLESALPGAKLAVDPNAPLPLRATTYYVLSPGESRVRLLTAFCNDGHDNVTVAMGDLVERGGSIDFFNPKGCSRGLGLADDCAIDAYPWFGFQGDAVAYGMRNYKSTELTTPEPSSAMIRIEGVVGTVSGAIDQAGLLQWLDTAATQRPGTFGIVAGQQRNHLRDLIIGRDLADIGSQLLAYDRAGKARLTVTVTGADGMPAPGARVAVIQPIDGKQVTLMVAGNDGKARADLPVGNYSLKVGLQGHAVEPASDVSLPATGLSKDLKLGAARRLRVTVKDPFGAPLTAKVTVVCPGGACATTSLAYRPFYSVDPLPSNVLALGFADATGVADLKLPPGQYEVLVSRGPEYNGWPDTFPATGRTVDLGTQDQALDAVLARVVDTDGWLSADLHVHAVNSADSSLANRQRVLSAAAEGLDVLLSGDHDAITDQAPVVRGLSLEGVLHTITGSEVSPFDYGHYQVFPLTRGASPNGGAFDWAGADGPTLRLDQLFGGLKAQHSGALVQMNHARGKMGTLTQLKVDTATLASHAEPAAFRMDAHAMASANDTKLMSDDFQAMEVHHGSVPSIALMNDWMTFNSRGRLKAATAVSDSHQVHAHTIGYGRTWVRLGAFSATGLTQALRDRLAVAGNGPFVRLSARRLDSTGTPVGASIEVGGTLSLTPANGEKVELTVDVQAPEWMTFDTLELFTHASGREALNGEANTSWPASRIHQSRTLDLANLTRELVPMQNGLSVRRIHMVEKFTVSPSSDTWYAVFVRGSAAARPLFPLVIDSVSCNASGACTTEPVAPWSFTNAVLIDADGSGKYDDFPLKGQMLAAPPKPKPAPPYRVPSLSEVERALRELKEHRHE